MRKLLVLCLGLWAVALVRGQLPFESMYGPEWWEGPWQPPRPVEGVNSTAHEMLLGANDGGLILGRMHVQFDAQWWEQTAEWSPFMTSRMGDPAHFDALEPMGGWGLQAPRWPGLGEVTHLAYDPSGTWAVLSAYRDEQREDVDLFLVTRTREGWSEARPLTALNTAYNEVFPNWIGGRLVFGSDRPGGAGGFDLYASDRLVSFRAPDRLKAPLNGPGDDVAAMGTLGGWYVCTARRGGQGGLDVWWVGREEEPVVEATAEGYRLRLVLDTGLPWNGATVELRGAEGAVWMREAVDADGEVALGGVPMRDQFSATVVAEADGAGGLEVWRRGERIMRLPVRAGVPFVLNLLALEAIGAADWDWAADGAEFPEPFSAVQILFAPNGHSLDALAQAELGRWWQRWGADASPGARLLITGYADSVGSRSRNAALSRERAEAVADWFRGIGVPEGALVVEGWADENPLPDAEWEGVKRRQPAYTGQVPCERRVEVRWLGW